MRIFLLLFDTLPDVMLKTISYKRFWFSTILTGLLLIPCFFAAWAEDEGTLGNNILLVTFSKLFYILRFPTHTLFWNFFSYNAGLFITGLILNCIFFGLLIERIYYNLKQKCTR